MSLSGLYQKLLSATEPNTLTIKNILELESYYFIGKMQKGKTKE